MQDGTARAWVELAFKEMDKVPTPDWTYIFDKFVSQLKKSFSDANEQATTQFKLRQLKQGSCLVEEFSMEFHLLAIAAGYDKLVLITMFKLAINDRILDSLYHIEPLPTSLDKWIESANQLDKQWQERQTY
jgi:hypothetical protein